jgi:hypothetical protein
MTIFNPCPKCGLVNIKLVPSHKRECRAVAPPPVTHKTIGPASLTPVISDSVTHAARSKGAVRQARYRAKDPEAYRQRHRDLMRRRRAAVRAAAISPS